ncbi:MAG: bifunctional adenosylcobinamide kinase/adenosylcobinamide-phosphate guanylyltransferase [Actinobacteria bacterium]|nr:bifunctional adenosylcobinamide kinase/adenosylcobinamide-phosphate guanylyltransferase [Actinomycetota bacterium]
MGRIVFITGGVRSGKSSQVLNMVEENKNALFLATALPSDEEMHERIQKHKEERPAGWRTTEATHGTLAEYIEGEEDILVIDCLTLYVGRRLTEGAPPEEIAGEVEAAVERMRVGFEHAVVVSNEVGSGVIPDNALARQFTEVLGQVNQLVAGRADEVLMMVSGIPLRVK